MEAPNTAKSLIGKFRGSLSAASATAGIVAGILGGWLTGHWLWAPFCFLLVLIIFVAVAEAIKARRETGGKGGLAANSPGLGGLYTSFSYTGETNRYGDNASVGNVTIGGRIDDRRKTVHRNSTIIIKPGGLWLIAALALVVVAGGTVYMARDPGSAVVPTPATLAAEGGHSSPRAAVMGFFGNAILNNWANACGYLPPSEQGACGPSPTETGSIAVGNAIVDDTLALVPVTGELCRYGKCATFRGNGLLAGETFQNAYTAAMDPTNTAGDLVPCEKVGNEWYVNGSSP
jgi:MFS family permease